MKRALVLAGGGSRGAFQIGVWKYLAQRNWKPDIICGSSVGAINAAAIGSGIDPDTLVRLWTTYNRRKMYRLNLLPFLARLISGRNMAPLLDTRPLKAMIKEHSDFDAIQNNSAKIMISAVNVHTGKPVFFDNQNITVNHILASSAMPVLFEQQSIDGVPYWDGGVMANIPLQPALDAGADEIIVVNLSPVGHTPQPFPQNAVKAGEHVFEQFLAASYQNTISANRLYDIPLPRTEPVGFKSIQGLKIKVFLLAPSRMLGFRSLLNFSLNQARELIDEGYKTAYTNLKPFI